MVRNIIRFIVLVPIGVYLLYSAYYFLTEEAVPRYNDCGVIVSKSSDEVAIKHGVRTELYLNVQFDKTGFKAVEVNPTTYFQFRKGDRVCFDLKTHMSSFHYVTSFIGFVVLIVIGVIGLVCLVIYMLDSDDKPKCEE